MHFTRKTQNLGKSQAYLDVFFYLYCLLIPSKCKAPKTILAVIIQSHDVIYKQKTAILEDPTPYGGGTLKFAKIFNFFNNHAPAAINTRR